ncbi:MAG TPA: S1 RNA-binding domain-containing protein, partial [Spirochaetes bacterium]|nr:S1 RNA-binding domain-containing protein [Spirochaetota bacterium]
VDISGKSEAFIDTAEFRDKEGNLTIKQGDTITAYVASIKRGEIILTSAIGRGMIAPELIENARQSGIPVEGTVTGLTNGGYRVSVSGIDCFCPHSQIDIKSPSAPEEMLNKTFSFMVLQVTERGRNIVLSRRQFMQTKQEEREKELKQSLNEGDIISGTVVSIQKFGLFVDLGGVEALVPRTEVSWSRTAELNAYAPGQSVKAKVLSMDWKDKRIVLSIKQTQPEPWDSIDEYREGRTINGTVTNIIRNGAFVEIAPGLEGFIPVSRMSPVKRIARPEDAVSKGTEVTVRIMEINRGDKKISLELVTDEADPWQTPDEDIADTIHVAVIESIRGNGITARLPNGMAGFIPREECAVKKGIDLTGAYSVGGDIKVMVKHLDRDNRRLKLSETGALKKEERHEYEKFMKTQEPAPDEGTAFGRLFKEKFESMREKDGDSQ